MPGIDENYASPGLRWGLLLEDHPGATYEFALLTGDQIPNGGVPASYGGERTFCVATITFPEGSTLAPVTAYKPVPPEGEADDWNTLCTKTQGRALKKAGYPDNLKDLKALVLWRQRNAEVHAIGTAASDGRATLAIGSGEAVTQALEAAGTSSPDGRSGDDDDGSGDAPHPETVAQIREAFGEVDAEVQAKAKAWADEAGFDLLAPPTEETASKVLTKLRATLAKSADDEVVDAELVPEGVDPATGELLEGDAAMVAELVAGLNADEMKLYEGYLATIGAPATLGEMTEEHIGLVMEWLEAGENV
ncbi:MAG TPA: hypothetical protein VMW08_00255 [Acidimicrobiales bacterium]|nr:hypothetical protein [Acidimicrobiales bacterium]